ncbi:hypothetical protein VP1G_10970 [Cytospora mali]|uniref:Uncharacterized protein n=1 Tax=Cytospora mali TaxID=578113 RepID=A0A194V229_CYTMA|nr:hypothetical protein VP1G_10970 [Valsa mali var. pyri (nom. inval.)]
MEVDLKASNGDCTESIDPEICQQECSMILEHQVDENTTSEDYSGLLAMKIVNYDGREKRTSILDCVQLSIEYFLGGDADWWPLPPLNHLQSPQQARLCWQYGDCELSIILNKDEEFHFLFDNSDIVATFDISNLSQVQPTDVCKGYDFTRRGEFPIDIQMRVYAETILYGIRYLELGRDKRTVLDGIPKLKAPPGLKREAMMIGWGFHAGQGLCVRKLLGLISFTLAFGLAFVPYWLASIDKLDLQNALAPVSFLATLIGIGLAMLAIAHAG